MYKHCVAWPSQDETNGDPASRVSHPWGSPIAIEANVFPEACKIVWVQLWLVQHTLWTCIRLCHRTTQASSVHTMPIASGQSLRDPGQKQNGRSQPCPRCSPSLQCLPEGHHLFRQGAEEIIPSFTGPYQDSIGAWPRRTSWRSEPQHHIPEWLIDLRQAGDCLCFGGLIGRHSEASLLLRQCALHFQL